MPFAIRPLTLRAANAFVDQHHRHNKAKAGHKFSIGLYDDDRLVGVAIASRPIARALDDGVTLEVARTCTDGTRNANSALYGAVWRAARAMGYRRAITYTQCGETGASLKAAGWRQDEFLPARSNWHEATADTTLNAKRNPDLLAGVDRMRWVVSA